MIKLRKALAVERSNAAKVESGVTGRSFDQ
jgi:hypothetical protein